MDKKEDAQNKLILQCALSSLAYATKLVIDDSNSTLADKMEVYGVAFDHIKPTLQKLINDQNA